MSGGGGGGQPTQSTVTQTNIPEYARPYVETMLGATQQQLFNTTTNPETGETSITGIKPYTPYSTDPTAYVAEFSPLQQQAMQGIAGLQTPEQYAAATQATQQAIQGALGTQYTPTQFTASDVQAPALQQYQMGPAQQVGAMQFNTPYMATARTGYTPGLFQHQMEAPKNITAPTAAAALMGTAQTAYRPDLEAFQMGPAERVGTGSFTDPGAAQAYMSPYIQQALAPQLAEIQRQSDIVQQGLKSQAVASGAFGGSRQALQAAEQERNKQQLMSQATGQGYQNAYQQAAQQYSTDAARQLAAQQANQAAGLTVGQQNLASRLGVQQLGTQTGAQMALANLSADQQARVQNQAAQMQAAGMNQQAALQTALANQQAGLTAGQQNLQAQLSTQQLGTQAGLQTALANLSAEQQANVQNQAAQLQTQGLNAQQAMQAALANQQAGLTVGQQNLAAQLQTQGLGAAQNLQAQLANQQAGLTAQQLSEQSRQYGAGLGLQGLGLGLQGAGQLAGIGGQSLQAQQGILGAQQQAGAMQQAQQQNIINQAIQNYATAQQYPQQQLAFMNAMLRGLPLQVATTQSYQAPMSPLGMIGGIGGQALGAYMARTGNMPFKKGGIVDSYADGGSTEVQPVQSEIEEKVMYHPEQYSADQIKQSIQNGIVSQLIGIPVLQHKEALAKQMAMAQAMNKPLPQQPINREVMAGAGQGVTAPMGAGIDQAPIPEDMFTAAGGGIVAFEDNKDQPVRTDMPDSEPTSPFGRWLSQFVPMGAERERGQYLGQLAQDIGFQGSVPGFFMSQTDEEKAAARKMDEFLAKNKSKLMKDPAEFAKFKENPWEYSGITKPEKITPGTATSFAPAKSAVPKETPPAAPAAAPAPKPAPVAAKPSAEMNLPPKQEAKVAATEDQFQKDLLKALGATTPTEQEETKAIGRAIMRGSAQLFGARRGQEGEKISKGFEEGVNAYDKYLEGLTKDKKELLRVYGEYMANKERVAATREGTEAQERVGMAGVAERQRATAAQERATAEQTATRRMAERADTVEKLSKEYSGSIYANQKKTLPNGQLNPNYKSFADFLRDRGVFNLYPELTQMYGATSGATGATGATASQFWKK